MKFSLRWYWHQLPHVLIGVEYCRMGAPLAFRIHVLIGMLVLYITPRPPAAPEYTPGPTALEDPATFRDAVRRRLGQQIPQTKDPKP